MDILDKFRNKKAGLLRKELPNELSWENVKNHLATKDEILGFLQKLKETFLSYDFEPDRNFVFTGRKKFIFDELVEIMSDKKQIDKVGEMGFIIGSLEEFIWNNNRISPAIENFMVVREKNDEYIKTGLICQEEKDIILDLIEKITAFVNDNY